MRSSIEPEQSTAMAISPSDSPLMLGKYSPCDKNLRLGLAHERSSVRHFSTNLRRTSRQSTLGASTSLTSRSSPALILPIILAACAACATRTFHSACCCACSAGLLPPSAQSSIASVPSPPPPSSGSSGNKL